MMTITTGSTHTPNLATRESGPRHPPGAGRPSARFRARGGGLSFPGRKIHPGGGQRACDRGGHGAGSPGPSRPRAPQRPVLAATRRQLHGCGCAGVAAIPASEACAGLFAAGMAPIAGLAAARRSRMRWRPGRPADVSQLRPDLRPALPPAWPRPALQHQGRRRPAKPDPHQPGQPARSPLTAS